MIKQYNYKIKTNFFNRIIVSYVVFYKESIFHSILSLFLAGFYNTHNLLYSLHVLCKNTNCTNKDKGGKNKTENADYNAAKNISKSEKHVENKEDCVYYKIQQEINLK